MFKRLILMLACLTVISCSPSYSDRDTLVMIIESSPTNLDPRVGTDAQSERIYDLIFDSLVHRDDHFEMKPALATSWDISPDGLTYTFHLRPGVRFHDGNALSSRDVKWTFDSVMNGTLISVKKATYRSVSSIDAPDEHTVVFHLSQPDASLLFNLSNGAMGIVPYGSDKRFANILIGSGPFKYVSQSQDNYVILEANEDYWGGAPSVHRLRFAVVPDATTRILELRKGSADIELNAVTSDMVDAVRLEYSDRLEISSSPGTGLQYIAFNLRDPALRDPRVRRAIALATDVTPVLHYLMRDLGRPANSVLPPEHWAYSDVGRAPHDTAQAIALLDAAGFHPDAQGIRLHLTMKTSTEEFGRLLAAILQAQLRKVGIQIDVRSYEFATFYADIVKGSYQMYSLRWVAGSNQDPDIFDYAFSSARMPPNGANRSYYSNPAVDKDLLAARSTTDQRQRKLLYTEIQQQLAQDLPYLDLWYMDNVVIHRKRIKNLKLSSAGNYEFLREIKLDDVAR